jgi:hypothetical protein
MEQNIIFYNTPNGNVQVEVLLQNETVWLSQQKIADVFGVKRPAITKHLKNTFESGELQENKVSSILEHTTTHGAIANKTQASKTKYNYTISSLAQKKYL